MNAMRALFFMKQYSKCPNCGNEKVAGGEGTISIEEDTFVRICKCGYRIKITELGYTNQN